MTERDEVLRQARQRQASDVRGLAREFVEPYGLDVQPPLESSPFAFHDGGHRRANIPATIYGELLQNVSDHATFDKLYGSGAIHGNPPSYREKLSGENFYVPGRSPFVNYGLMGDKSEFNERAAHYTEMGVDPKSFEPGGEYGWDTEQGKGVLREQAGLSGIMRVGEDRFSKGDFTFFQGAGGYQPEHGFLPTADLRNTREVAPQDVNTARVRGENFADALQEGYKAAVAEGRYTPQRGLQDGMIHAADLSDAGMQGHIRVGRGWADEGIFPYQDRIGALSNPPARIDPRVAESDVAMSHVMQLAEDARSARALDRVSRAVGTGFNATTDLAGSVPLFDPEFRQAVERGDIRKAGEQVAKEYLGGTAAAAVMGLGTGVSARLAPQATAAVLPVVAGATRIANPVAVVSQLGGDSAQPRVVGTYQGTPIREVWGSGDKPRYLVQRQGPGDAGMTRLGQAKLNGKTVYVPYGSVAGERRVGHRIVGRPWWDLGQHFGR